MSHTTDTHTKLTYNLGSAQTKFTWHDGRYAHAQLDRGGADACAFGRGGAESTTFDLNPLNADCVYIRACAPVSQRGMRIYMQLCSGGLVRMSIAIEEAPDNHRRQIHPYLACSSCN